MHYNSYLWGDMELKRHIVLFYRVSQRHFSGLHHTVQQGGDLHHVAISLVHILGVQLNVSFICLQTQQKSYFIASLRGTTCGSARVCDGIGFFFSFLTELK